MTRELVRLGYSIPQAGKAWEITGISRETIERFSKRRKHIERRLAEELKNPVNAGLESKESGIVTAEDGERITSVDGLRREWEIVEHARRERAPSRPSCRATPTRRRSSSRTFTNPA